MEHVELNHCRFHFTGQIKYYTSSIFPSNGESVFVYIFVSVIVSAFISVFVSAFSSASESVH